MKNLLEQISDRTQIEYAFVPHTTMPCMASGGCRSCGTP